MDIKALQVKYENTHVELVVNSAHVHAYLTDDAKHRRAPKVQITGTWVKSPKWFADYVTVENATTGRTHHVPHYLILQVNEVTPDVPQITSDRTFEVPASKGGTPYKVTQNGVTKKWSCTCSGWQFRQKCRHVTELQAKDS
jgi:hypothetical protein